MLLTMPAASVVAGVSLGLYVPSFFAVDEGPGNLVGSDAMVGPSQLTCLTLMRALAGEVRGSALTH